MIARRCNFTCCQPKYAPRNEAAGPSTCTMCAKFADSGRSSPTTGKLCSSMFCAKSTHAIVPLIKLMRTYVLSQFDAGPGFRELYPRVASSNVYEPLNTSPKQIRNNPKDPCAKVATKMPLSKFSMDSSGRGITFTESSEVKGGKGRGQKAILRPPGSRASEVVDSAYGASAVTSDPHAGASQVHALCTQRSIWQCCLPVSSFLSRSLVGFLFSLCVVFLRRGTVLTFIHGGGKLASTLLKSREESSIAHLRCSCAANLDAVALHDHELCSAFGSISTSGKKSIPWNHLYSRSEKSCAC